MGPRPGGIWAFVRSICAILKGFQPHEANFKSGECLAFWPHEPHEVHSLRRKNLRRAVNRQPGYRPGDSQSRTSDSSYCRFKLQSPETEINNLLTACAKQFYDWLAWHKRKFAIFSWLQAQKMRYVSQSGLMSHVMRQKNFESNLFDIKNYFRDSKQKSADAFNFVGLGKISFDQI